MLMLGSLYGRANNNRKSKNYEFNFIYWEFFASDVGFAVCLTKLPGHSNNIRYDQHNVSPLRIFHCFSLFYLA